MKLHSNSLTQVLRNTALAGALGLTALLGSGCQSDAQTGGLVGAGLGALAGQAIGRNTTGTLIGTAVGAGAGYVIGNESDKNKARNERLYPDDRYRDNGRYRENDRYRDDYRYRNDYQYREYYERHYHYYDPCDR